MKKQQNTHTDTHRVRIERRMFGCCEICTTLGCSIHLKCLTCKSTVKKRGKVNQQQQHSTKCCAEKIWTKESYCGICVVCAYWRLLLKESRIREHGLPFGGWFDILQLLPQRSIIQPVSCHIIHIHLYIYYTQTLSFFYHSVRFLVSPVRANREMYLWYANNIKYWIYERLKHFLLWQRQMKLDFVLVI